MAETFTLETELRNSEYNMYKAQQETLYSFYDPTQIINTGSIVSNVLSTRLFKNVPYTTNDELNEFLRKQITTWHIAEEYAGAVGDVILRLTTNGVQALSFRNVQNITKNTITITQQVETDKGKLQIYETNALTPDDEGNYITIYSAILELTDEEEIVTTTKQVLEQYSSFLPVNIDTEELTIAELQSTTYKVKYPYKRIFWKPNIYPNYNIDLMNWPRSDYAAATSIFNSIERIFELMNKELISSGYYAMIPEDMLSYENGRVTFNDEAEAKKFIKTKSSDNLNDKDDPHFVTPPLRIEEYTTAIKTAMSMAFTKCGVSPRSAGFGETTGGSYSAATATEIRSTERTTYDTIEKKQMTWNIMFQELLEAYAIQQGIDTDPERDFVLTWDFDEIESTNTKANRLAISVTNGILSRKTAMKELHPEWDTIRIDEEVEQLVKEQVIFSENRQQIRSEATTKTTDELKAGTGVGDADMEQESEKQGQVTPRSSESGKSTDTIKGETGGDAPVDTEEDKTLQPPSV